VTEREQNVVTAPARPEAKERARGDRFTEGAQFAGFVIRGALGEGGMGAVYRAFDPRLSREIALKVLPSHEADEEARARFLREAQALARVDHESVVRVHASGVDDGIAWMALALIEGDALDRLLVEERLDEETALLLCASCARGLAAVHTQGVVHRDVKPANLLVDENGQLRIVDFGIASFTDGDRGGFKTRDGLAVGTPHYMAPEQARGGAVDARADAWGLGATLYAMLAGAPPFFHTEDEADVDILARVVRDRAPDVRARAPDVSFATSALLARLLEPDREKRPSDLAAIAHEMESLVDALAGGAASTTEPKEAARAPRAEHAAVPAPTPTPAPSSIAAGIGVALVVGALLVGGVALIALSITDDKKTLVEAPPDLPRDPPGDVPPVVDAPPLRLGTPVVETPKDAAPDPLELLSKDIVDDTKTAPVSARALVRRDDEAARALMKTLIVSEGPGAHVVAALVEERPPHAVEVVSVALAHADPAIALRAVSALVTLRPIEAIDLLNGAAKTHPSPSVRARASEARRALFSVEGE